MELTETLLVYVYLAILLLFMLKARTKSARKAREYILISTLLLTCRMTAYAEHGSVVTHPCYEECVRLQHKQFNEYIALASIEAMTKLAKYRSLNWATVFLKLPYEVLKLSLTKLPGPKGEQYFACILLPLSTGGCSGKGFSTKLKLVMILFLCNLVPASAQDVLAVVGVGHAFRIMTMFGNMPGGAIYYGL